MNNCTETQAESRAVWDGLARRSPSPKSASDASSQPGCQDAPALSGSSFCRQYLGHIEKTPQCNPPPPRHTHTHSPGLSRDSSLHAPGSQAWGRGDRYRCGTGHFQG